MAKRQPRIGALLFGGAAVLIAAVVASTSLSFREMPPSSPSSVPQPLAAHQDKAPSAEARKPTQLMRRRGLPAGRAA
jgi:hypothetical protein